MMRLQVTADTVDVEQKTWVFAGIAIGLLVIGGLNALILVVMIATGKLDPAVIGPGIACLVGGYFFAQMPRKRTLQANRTAGTVSCDARTLFGRTSVTCALADVSAVSVKVGTYWNFVSLERRLETSVLVLTFSKSWTWQTTAGSGVLRDAKRLAEFFGVPLVGNTLPDKQEVAKPTSPAA